jgi:ketosteroid isomerase-like protein
MKKQLLISLSIALLLFCSSAPIRAQEKAWEADEDYIEIKKLFLQQEADWNKGDIDAFMKAYWKSEELQFGGASGITRGWQQTLDRYKKSYPDRETMGKLSFQVKDMTRHSPEVISLTGSWVLEREKDKPGGHFLLIWRKIDSEWKIVVDHTSQKQSLLKNEK